MTATKLINSTIGNKTAASKKSGKMTATKLLTSTMGGATAQNIWNSAKQ